MSDEGRLFQLQRDTWVWPLDSCDYTGTGERQHLGLKIYEKESVIFLGKKRDILNKELFLVVLTRLGLGIILPSSL